MLVNLRDICAIAEQNNMAIGQFNAPTLEAVRAVIDAAEATGYPVMLGHAEVHESVAPLDVMGRLWWLWPSAPPLPCACTSITASISRICVAPLRWASAVPCTTARWSRMRSTSRTPPAQRQWCTILTVALSASWARWVRARAGASNEGGTAEEAGAIYTDPDQAREFVEATGLDVLACSFGTVHGLYKGEPHLSFDVLTQIRDRVKVPLVMHGGSGVSDEDYHKAIDAGIRKINYFTYGDKFAAEAACSVVDAERAAAMWSTGPSSPALPTSAWWRILCT